MTTPSKYIEKPVVVCVEAMEFDGTAVNAAEIMHWVSSYSTHISFFCRDREEACRSDNHVLSINTVVGSSYASKGFVVFKDSYDKFLVCSSEKFKERYSDSAEDEDLRTQLAKATEEIVDLRDLLQLHESGAQ